jgi:hypothetical protein
MKHYLVLTFPVGKEHVRREHFALAHEDETLDEAIERWVVVRLGKRQRNRAKAATKLKVSILHARIARPSSYWVEQAEKNGTAYPAPVGRKSRRART